MEELHVPSVEKKQDISHSEDVGSELKYGIPQVEGTTRLFFEHGLVEEDSGYGFGDILSNSSTVGAISIGLQQNLTGLLPVFMFVYAGLNPKLLNSVGGLSSVAGSSNSTSSGSSSTNALAALGNIPGAQPLSRVNLLNKIPVLMVGLSNYFLVPLSVVVGRRAVLVFCGGIAWVACIWAANSTSLSSHIGARCAQAIGAGAVESLVPLVVQDMSFIHERNRVISLVWASQGIITISLGVNTNYIVARLGWEWLYYIGGTITAVSWLMILLFVPETRWHRSNAELKGDKSHLPEGMSRPEVNYERFGRPSNWVRYGFFANGGIELKEGATAAVQIARSLFLPGVFYFVLLNSAMLAASIAATLTASTVLLSAPYSWPQANIGLMVLGTAVANCFVAVVGHLGDKLSNRLAKRNDGIRELEVHLWNMIFPVFAGVLGCVLYGVGGTYEPSQISLCFQATFKRFSGFATPPLGFRKLKLSRSLKWLITFALFTINVIGSVFCIESYPQIAGPVLVNVSSFRNIIGFGVVYGVTDWVAIRSYMATFGILAGVIVTLSLPLPLFFIYGRKWRESSKFATKILTHSF
ncbi:hypothetical protein G7Y89_g11612 [Cudoniella acicularis]|uniref:Major facilitator superfamily (MFS) profile domain-containing protein n=1 Tax=Cudoniella acicularis TaxID=354080 RepID=A0A8H4VY51_9HELO|nr:hypothetical protein G7Y89_g11612 [Cudoniella acicularis]